MGLIKVDLIKNIADNYEKEYGFMALNATKHNALMFHKIHDEVSVEELHKAHDELLKRGFKDVKSEEEFIALCKIHGVPKHFKELYPDLDKELTNGNPSKD